MPKVNNIPQEKPWYRRSSSWAWIVTGALVLAFQIAAENENLTLREFRDIVWSKSLCFLLHMYF